jgi:stage V sporulation protein S
MPTLRVSATSRPHAVAGAIAALLRSEGNAEMQAIGAVAVNQALKAAVVARAYLAQDALDLTLVPSFTSVAYGEESRTAMHFSIRATARSESSHEPIAKPG